MSEHEIAILQLKMRAKAANNHRNLIERNNLRELFKVIGIYSVNSPKNYSKSTWNEIRANAICDAWAEIGIHQFSTDDIESILKKG